MIGDSMKSNKGFTLVEIIVCITLIVLIGTISFISIKLSDKNNKEKIKNEFINDIKAAANIFIETNQDVEKFQLLKNPGDYIFIQLKELVDIGLLDENEINPFENKTLKERKCDVAKVLLDNHSAISVEFPVRVFENKSCDEIYQEMNIKTYIDLNNNDEFNYVNMDSSDIIWAKYIMEGLTFETIKYGDYYSDKYKINESSYVLRNYETGEEIPTTVADWDNECVFVNGTTDSLPYWECNYSLKESSKYYDNWLEKETKKRIVELRDNSAPILIEPINSNGSYSSFYYDQNNYGIFENIFSKEYSNDGGITSTPRLIDCYTGESYYEGFDNWDGNIYYTGGDENFIISDDGYKITLTDTSSNSSIFEAGYVDSYEAPQIDYYGPTYFNSREELSNMFNNTAWSGNLKVYEVKLCDYYDNCINYYEEDKLSDLDSGTYTLSGFAYDGSTCAEYEYIINVDINDYYCPTGDLIGYSCRTYAYSRPKFDYDNCVDIYETITDESMCGCAMTQHDVCINSCYSSGWSNPESCADACWIGGGPACVEANTCTVFWYTDCPYIGEEYYCDDGWVLGDDYYCYNAAEIR